jgi:PAS domain S-box-containing protein
MPFILVADDRPLNRHFLMTLLSYYGHEVREAADGVEALHAARERKPDLIIADVLMPRLDGPALARAVRADRGLADVPIIFYSASYQEVEAQAIARSAGVDYVITKPSDPEVILETISRALQRPSPVAPKPARGSDPREVVARLQLASIRMTAIIELMVHLSSERDPHELLRTACLATRKIFGAQYAVLAAGGETLTDGDVDTNHLPGLVDRLNAMIGAEPARASGGTGSLVAAALEAMAGAWSALLVPMRSRGNPHGWLLLVNKRDAPAFSTDDESLASAAAAQIRAEHESLRAERAERQRIESELVTLVDAAPVPIIAYDRDLLVQLWNPAAERTFGWRAGEVAGKPNPSIPPDFAAEFKRLAEECLLGTTLGDIEHRRLRKDGTVVHVKALMAPVRDAAGRPRGFVSIVSDLTALHASRERLRALSARVLSVQEEERTRLARELHDGVGQLLTALKIDASKLLQDLARSVKPPKRVTDGLLPLIDTTMDTVVRLVSELRPSRIGEMGLAAAIAGKLAEFRRRTGIRTESRCPEILPVPDAVAIAAFRILEEALSNVARHSGARWVKVTLTENEGALHLVIQDNGKGISEADRTAPDAYGLIGMKERAVILGGTVEIVRGKRGTVVTARIPLGDDSSVHRR